ncbi:MAG: acyltransferase family protein, partial [Kovacikia sp.]
MLQKTKGLTFRRITEFEGLRALLAWWFFLGHALVFSGFTDSKSLPIFASWLLENGYAVDVFIILSGFVIFLLLDTNPHKSYAQFIVERLFRIYPIFLVALLVGVALTPLQA